MYVGGINACEYTERGGIEELTKGEACFEKAYLLKIITFFILNRKI